jgi:hypothetical protein
LQASGTIESSELEVEDDDTYDVPEEIESVLEELFRALQDKACNALSYKLSTDVNFRKPLFDGRRQRASLGLWNAYQPTLLSKC